MATRIAATRLSSLLPTLRQAANRQIACSRPTFPALPCSHYTRHYWSTSEPVGSHKEKESLNQEKNAYDILAGDTGPSSHLANSDPDLDIELPPSVFAERVQPNLINIPPQQDPLLQFLASRLMNHGHRQKASRIVSRTLLNIHAYTRAPPLPILRRAIFALSPAVRLLKHRHSTKTIYKPVAVSEKRGVFFRGRDGYWRNAKDARERRFEEEGGHACTGHGQPWKHRLQSTDMKDLAALAAHGRTLENCKAVGSGFLEDALRREIRVITSDSVDIDDQLPVRSSGVETSGYILLSDTNSYRLAS
ncbi:hypothetical protein BT96DRAFT_1015341 [Gymnopus androsaceus JB14]|uniref:Small ribosomal subunit protein uS7 domain-containing protein n=1 Tax=Gymnopus androsaceus JB14 TaxID=1447944 RepID=A0A6A4IAQ0_9AGAR|nr:hypothetical protein BT96DRAFT_1015341 [Gymnopus androsaceus JB14]